jgi:hypothetical protein
MQTRICIKTFETLQQATQNLLQCAIRPNVGNVVSEVWTQRWNTGTRPVDLVICCKTSRGALAGARRFYVIASEAGLEIGCHDP